MRIEVKVWYDPEGSNVKEYFEDASDLKPSDEPGVLATFKSKGKEYVVKVESRVQGEAAQ
jgi:hypothetical protein